MIPLVLKVTLPEGIYIDRANLRAELISPPDWALKSIQTPPGITKTVGGFSTEVLTASFEAILPLSISDNVTSGEHKVELNFFYVSCTGDLCIPHTDTLTTVVEVSDAASTSPSSGAAQLTFLERLARRWTESVEGGNYAFAFLLAFLGGFLLSLTPCVLPMIPIVVQVLVGGRDATAGKRVTASVVYTVGLALVYAILGLIAARGGGLLGGLLQKPWVLVAFTTLFGVLALSMFGLFELQVPPSIQSKLQFQTAGNLFGAFVMGLISGLIASPCIGPFILGVLVLIAKTEKPVLGFGTLFTMGVGLGSPFIAAAVVGGRLLKPGAWMVTVKKVLGLLLLLGCAYFANLAGNWTGILAAMGIWALLVIVAAYFLPRIEVGTPRHDQVMGTVQGGSWGVLLTLLFGLGFNGSPSQTSGKGVSMDTTPSTVEAIAWRHDVKQALADAKAQSKPAMLYFTADWCLPCKELSHGIFLEAEVVAESARFVCIKADITDDSDPEVVALQQEYFVKSPPIIFFHDRSGNRVEKDVTEALVGKESIEAGLLARMRSIK